MKVSNVILNDNLSSMMSQENKDKRIVIQSIFSSLCKRFSGQVTTSADIEIEHLANKADELAQRIFTKYPFNEKESTIKQ